MKNLTLTTLGQYEVSNSIFTGTKKQVLKRLRNEAKSMRRESRISRHLEDSVHAIHENLHPSILVTIASFELNNMGVNSLLKLINNHGVIKYKIG